MRSRQIGARVGAQPLELDLVDQRDAQRDQQQRGAIWRQRSGASRRVPARWPRALAVMAITTGSVPMIMVGSGPPVRWMALARNR